MEFNYLNILSVENLKRNNEILVVEDNYCTTRETKFIINKTSNDDASKDKSKSYIEFVITGYDNEYIKGSFSDSGILLKTQYDKSIFYVKDNNWKVHKKEIYNNEKQENIISDIYPKNTGSYIVDFVNLAQEKSDFLEVVSDKDLQICDIFYGESAKKAPIICKIIRKENNCEVFVASGVDYYFILGLASIFFCNNPKNNYDKIAQIEMPTMSMMKEKDVSKDKSNNEITVDPTIMTHKTRNLCKIILCCSCFERCLNFIESNDEDNSKERAEAAGEALDCCEVCCDAFECFNDDECCDCGDCGDCDCSGCDCGGCDFGGCTIM